MNPAHKHPGRLQDGFLPSTHPHPTPWQDLESHVAAFAENHCRIRNIYLAIFYLKLRLGKQNNGDFAFWGAFHRQGERQRSEGVKGRTSCKRRSSPLPRLFPVSVGSRLLSRALVITLCSAGLTPCFVCPKGELVSALEMLTLSQSPHM